MGTHNLTWHSSSNGLDYFRHFHAQFVNPQFYFDQTNWICGSDCSPPSGEVSYTAHGQVLEERESGVVQAQQVWSPVYVDALILRDRNADGNNTNGPNGDGLEQRHYVAQDANFNVTALINAETGAVVERYYYQAYGVPTVLDANFVPRATGQIQFAWRYLHQGGRFDWASGYYHFRNRDLSPTLGRWINHDPIGFEGSKWNLYEYVEGRPTVGLDPSGEIIWVPVIVACMLVAGTPSVVNAPGPSEPTYTVDLVLCDNAENVVTIVTATGTYKCLRLCKPRPKPPKPKCDDLLDPDSYYGYGNYKPPVPSGSPGNMGTNPGFGPKTRW